MNFAFDESERSTLAEVLNEKAWNLCRDLEDVLRILVRVGADDGRRAIDDVCESIARIAAQTREDDS